MLSTSPESPLSLCMMIVVFSKCLAKASASSKVEASIFFLEHVSQSTEARHTSYCYLRYQ